MGCPRMGKATTVGGMGPHCTSRDLERAEGLGSHCFKSYMNHICDVSGLHTGLSLESSIQPLPKRPSNSQVLTRLYLLNLRIRRHECQANDASVILQIIVQGILNVFARK